MAKTASEKQGMVTEVTTVQNFDLTKVMGQVQIAAGAWNKTSLNFVAACTVAFIAGTFPQDDKQRKPIADIRDMLKLTLRGANVGQSQTYNYIQTAQSLAARINKEFKFGGLMHAIMVAKNERDAVETVNNALEAHGWLADKKAIKLDWSKDAEKKPVFSIDVLRVNLGLDELKTPLANDPLKFRKGGSKRRGGRGGSARAGQTATKADARSVVARITADADVQKAVPAETVVGMASTVVGRFEMVARMIALFTEEECKRAQKELPKLVNDRIKELNKPATPAADTVPGSEQAAG